MRVRASLVVLLALGLLVAGPAVGAADDSQAKQGAQQVESGAKQIGKGIENTAKGVGDKIKEAGEAAEPKAKTAWESTRDGAVTFGQSVKTFFTRLFGS